MPTPRRRERVKFNNNNNLAEKVQVTEGLIDDEQEKKNIAYECFMNLEKVYDRVNRKTLWQVSRM